MKDMSGRAGMRMCVPMIVLVLVFVLVFVMSVWMAVAMFMMPHSFLPGSCQEYDPHTRDEQAGGETQPGIKLFG